MTGTESQTPSVADRSTEFVAVQGGGETSSAAGLLTAAYILMWLFVFAMIWLTQKKLAGFSARLDLVEKGLGDASKRT